MNTNDSTYLWGENQLKEISSKTLDPIATEVGEIIILYNDEFNNHEKEALKGYLTGEEVDEKDLSENFIKVRDIVDTWSDSIKEYCLVKLRTQDDLFEDLTAEE